MTTILPPERNSLEAIMSQVGRGLSQTLPGAVQQHGQREHEQNLLNERNKAIADIYGPSIAQLPPDLQNAYINNQMSGEKYKQQYQAKTNAQLELMNKLGIGDLFSQNQNVPQENNENQPQSQGKSNFDPRQITDEDIAKATIANPQLGQMLRQLKDVALREARGQEELALKKKKLSPEHQREEKITSAQAQEDVKYNKQLQEAAKQHELKQQTLDRLESLNKKGVTGKPFEKLLEKMGLVALTSEGRREFAADVKNLITDIRSILGAQFTGFEFQTILNAYPSADFSKEANNAIINNLKDFQDIKTKEVEFGNELKRQNKGKIPFDFQTQVNEKVREYAQSKIPQIKANNRKIMNEEYGIKPGFILMFDSKGEPLNVPEGREQDAISKGAIMP